MEVQTKASKTDLFCWGFTVQLGVTQRRLCPVEAILSFLVLRGTGPGPLFKFENGKFLTRAKVVDKLHAALSMASYPRKSMLATALESGQPPQQPNVVWKTP